MQATIDRVNLEVVKTSLSKDITLEHLEVLCLNNFIESNFQAYVASIETFGFSTIEDLNSLIIRTNLGVIRDYSLKGESVAPTAEHIRGVGVQNIVDEHIDSYNGIMKNLSVKYLLNWAANVKDAANNYKLSVESQDFFNNVEPLQNLIHAINMDVVRKSPQAVNIKQIEGIGIERGIESNISLYQKAISENVSGILSLADLQTLIDRENALSNIRTYRFVGNINLVNKDMLDSIGLKYVIEENLEYYKSAILKSGAGFPGSFTAMQALINRVNAEHSSVEDIKASGAYNITDEKFYLYSAAISAANSTGNSAALQALVDMENAISEIRDYCLSNNASRLTTEQLKKTGVDSFIESEFENYRIAIASTGAISDISNLQSVVNYINAIKNQSVGIDELINVGIIGAVISNIDRYRTAGFIPNISDMQKIINKANLEAVQAFVGSGNAIGLKLEQLTAIRKADNSTLNIIEENLSGYRERIGSGISITDVETLEKIIDAENALAVIREYRLTGDASALTLAQLNAAGVQNVEQAYIEAYKRAIATSVSIANLPALQALINEVNKRN